MGRRVGAIDVANTWWQPIEMRRYQVTPHADFTHTIRNNRTDRCEYIFSSLITRSQHPCFSRNEYNFFAWLDIQPDVKTFRSQPQSVTYLLDGEEHTYTADAIVHYDDDVRAAIEVKHEYEARLDKNAPKWHCLRKVFAANDMNFAVITDEDLEADPLLHNVQTIRREVHSRPRTDAVYRMRTAFEQDDEVPFSRLMECVQQPENVARMQVLHMICMRQFTFDLSKARLQDHTPIQLVRNRESVGERAARRTASRHATDPIA